MKASAKKSRASRSAPAAGKDLRPEYDLKQLGTGIRGKYLSRATASTNVVLIEPDLAPLFPDGESVNRALRMLAETAKAAAQPRKHNRM